MPGASIGRHTHETNSEIMYIVSGTATFTVGDTVEAVQAGQCHYCLLYTSFTDISSSHYAYNAVKWGVKYNIVTGTTTTTFSPDEQVTRCLLYTSRCV